MSSRKNILDAIANNQPEFVKLPEIDDNIVISYEDNYQQFKIVLENIGGSVQLVDNIEIINERLIADKERGDFVVNTILAIGSVDYQLALLTSNELEKVNRAYIGGTIAVAENGAVWIYERQMVNRLLPFICQHLILVIDKKDIVATMHQAYDCIDVAKEGFGVFIAGPSKTADIEQSLVIGAHGARRTTIYVVG